MNFGVLIIGTDINAYYMARCYHELYHEKVDMIGKQGMAFTNLSNIINLTLVPNLDSAFAENLNQYAKEKKLDKILLIATNDGYVRLIVENQDKLDSCFVYNYPRLGILNNLLVKDNFYQAYGDVLDIPKTYIYSCSKQEKLKDEFTYPIVLKPGNGVEYYKHHFDGMSKVYKLFSFEELEETIRTIVESGYRENLIIQEFVPGGDDALYDAIFYCGKDKKVKLMTFAQIGLQERTHTGVGNCTLLVNGFDEHGLKDEVVYRLKDFLEDIEYQGFAEFDLKYDSRDGKYKVFEINPRQARSSYYLAACGHNLVKYLIDDVILGETIPFHFMKEKMVLSFVPKGVIKKYVESEPLKKEIFALIREGKFVRPLHYSLDTHFKRKIYLFLRDMNYYKKYKNLKW